MLRFEQYLQEFNATVNLQEFLINLMITAFLALVLRWFYTRFGSSISNRQKFAMNFIPLALTTFLIITVIKSSLALSLGLVGALSIVRFRAAIKDPEELTYLFLTIGVGLVTGANKPILAVLATACILPLVFLNKRISREGFKQEDRMFVNIHTDYLELDRISKIVTENFKFVELKRMDQIDNRIDLSYVCNVESLETLDQVRLQLTELSDQTQISFVDKPDLIV
ncbi:MAG: DUF4956 domain-containing protein [Saprospiraceae bacterium]|nr:DUF4956 domain-containing protein [Saprospiraceae bacterium]